MVSGEAGPNGPNVTSTVELGHRSECESARNPRTEAWAAKAVLRTLRTAQRQKNAPVQSSSFKN